MYISDNTYLVKSIIANCYLVSEGSHFLLIDTGLPGNQERIIAQIRTLGRRISDISDIVITHADADHYGSAKSISEFCSANISANLIEAQAIRSGEMSRELHPTGVKKQIYNLYALFMKTVPTSVNIDLIGDEVFPYLGGLQVLNTPGHTPGHISLFSPSTGILFAGDSIWIKKGILIPSSGDNCWNEEQAKISFQRQVDLHPQIVCMGHGIFRAQL